METASIPQDTPSIGEAAGSASAAVQQYGFADMRLRVGDRLQLSPPARVSAERFPVKLVGYMEGVSVRVTHPYERFLRVPLHEGDAVVVGGFVGQSACGFSAWVEKLCMNPFDYIHLSFPEAVQGMAVRKAPRVRTRIIASVTNLSGNSAESLPALVANMSATGILLDSNRALCPKDSRVRMAFKVQLHGVEALLTVDGIARSVWTGESGTEQASICHHGVEFVDLDPNDRMILQSVVYQHMIESPQNLI